MMHKQTIAVSRSWRSFFFRGAVFNSGLNEEKEENEKPRYARLMKLDGEDVVWGHIEECAKVKTYGRPVYGITDEALNLDGFTYEDILIEKVSYFYKNSKWSTAMLLIWHSKFHIYLESFFNHFLVLFLTFPWGDIGY